MNIQIKQKDIEYHSYTGTHTCTDKNNYYSPVENKFVTKHKKQNDITIQLSSTLR